MRHWNRTVSLATAELAEYLHTEIKRRWPEERYPFHIEVLADAIGRQLEVRVWNRDGVHVVRQASPEASPNSRGQSPTVVAVMEAVDSAVAEAQGNPGPPKADAHHA